jgi:hypothetical protein
MGNRGILHDQEGRLGQRRWQHQSWIACTLVSSGSRRPLAEPGYYTVLFFHDEAVALAAGHRPCAQCRRADYNRFVAAWKAGHGMEPKASILARDMGASLHRARVTPDRRQVRYLAPLKSLPGGAFVALPEKPNDAWLAWDGSLHRWSHEGYGEHRALHDAVVEVLTPAPAIRALAAGYLPDVLSLCLSSP